MAIVAYGNNFYFASLLHIFFSPFYVYYIKVFTFLSNSRVSVFIAGHCFTMLR